MFYKIHLVLTIILTTDQVSMTPEERENFLTFNWSEDPENAYDPPKFIVNLPPELPYKVVVPQKFSKALSYSSNVSVFDFST